MADSCSTVDAINPVIFQRGAAFPTEMLWLYAENDSFYRTRHSRKNFDAFVATGGKGTFRVFPTPAGQNGHFLINSPDLWQDSVEAYLGQVERK